MTTRQRCEAMQFWVSRQGGRVPEHTEACCPPRPLQASHVRRCIISYEVMTTWGREPCAWRGGNVPAFSHRNMVGVTGWWAGAPQPAVLIFAIRVLGSHGHHA